MAKREKERWRACQNCAREQCRVYPRTASCSVT